MRGQLRLERHADGLGRCDLLLPVADEEIRRCLILAFV